VDDGPSHTRVVPRLLPSGHSEDREWWWSGYAWLPAYSADRQRWFNGFVWVNAVPDWRRWTYPVGLAVLLLGVVGSAVGGLASMGDPGPGKPDVSDPAWVVPAAIAGCSLIVVGSALLLASPIWRLRRRLARAR
jgi:hypothetical protein